MKNIVICFDGTWNTADAEFPTNVVKTAQMVSPSDSHGVAQVVFYDEGVGSTQVAFGNAINQLLGGAFGAGLMENIERAYRFLILNYAPGDRIFLFGFSRGAFSARSFAGLLRICGILRKDRLGMIGEALALYRGRADDIPADAEHLMKFRRENSFSSYSDHPDPGCKQHPLTIEYLGVWDTVGALGIPREFWFASRFNKKFEFHDLELSPMVKSARHVLGIDERRSTFAPTQWTNLDALNRAAGEGPGGWPYEQVWFPGDHASVGGGGTVNGLWQASLIWVVEGGQWRGLSIDAEKLEEYRGHIDHRVSVNSIKGFSLSSISFKRARIGPAGKLEAELASIGQLRARAAAADLFDKQLYRPKPLKAYLTAFGEKLGISI